ncbi:MAG: carboxylating nicotinate-nucleotide diphosphorylase [Armatimonadetes bacterium]|nr:carboxylating nicotinate-nucleotide diphosphorylase [Armatimonadota bacterium]
MTAFELREDVRRWLAEALGSGDVTSLACVPPDRAATGRLVAKQAGVLAGLPPAMAVFAELNGARHGGPLLTDGDELVPGALIAELRGSARSILAGERLALNLLQRLSGVATLTRRFVEAVAGRAAILDTRKTTPGLRALEKAAVRAGGGRNHRFGLFDGVLIKDNHIVAAGGIAAAVRAARDKAPHTLVIEVEVETPAQVTEALAAGATALLLDNMPLDRLRDAVERCRGRAWTEASGGITLETVAAVADTGVDAISVGALTQSAPALDISLDLELE